MNEKTKHFCTFVQQNIIQHLKGNEVPTYASTWLNFENKVLSKQGQSQKHKYCVSTYMKCAKWANP
jgi:hypothetical protein